MAYDVNKKDGTLLVSIADGSTDSSSTTLKLLGRGVTNYGEIMAENLVWLTENFANNSQPGNPLDGQLWFDKSDLKMKVRHSAAWNPINGITVSATTPVGTFVEGDLWWDQDDDQLYGWDDDGSSWVLIGPSVSTLDPNIALDAAMIGIDLDPGPGQLIIVIVDGEVVAAWSDDTYNTATYINNNVSITIGGTSIPVNLPTAFPSGVLPGCNLNNATLTAGSPVFNGTAVTSQYADLAERYHADSEMEAGDVVKIGGVNEVTKTVDELDTQFFGVVSRSPALMMNNTAGPDETHPYIALAGRIPVKVIGFVTKGQRLACSSTPGVARGISEEEAKNNILSIIGRALEDKLIEEESSIEVAIGRK